MKPWASLLGALGLLALVFALVSFVAWKVAAREWEAGSVTVEQALQAAWDAIAVR